MQSQKTWAPGIRFYDAGWLSASTEIEKLRVNVTALLGQVDVTRRSRLRGFFIVRLIAEKRIPKSETRRAARRALTPALLFEDLRSGGGFRISSIAAAGPPAQRSVKRQGSAKLILGSVPRQLRGPGLARRN